MSHVKCLSIATIIITINNHYSQICFSEKQIYCKSCYGKNRGPKGYGFGSGAGTLSMDAGGGTYATQTGPLTTTNTPYLGGNRCPRCKGSVYHAEEILAAGYVSFLYMFLKT